MGCSACAIRAGASIDTSMGFTPVEGLLMGTRSGDLDPSILEYLAHKEGMGLHEIESMLNKQSGLLGISVLTGDLRSLNPIDWDAIADSVRKTSKVLVLTEDSRAWGYGAEIAARIGEELYADLDGPVRRLAATDTFVAYAPELEDFILPQAADILKAVEELAAF